MMSKDDLREIARQGGIAKAIVREEEKLADWHGEFPEYFLTQAAPLLLRPEMRNGAGLKKIGRPFGSKNKNTNGGAPRGPYKKKKRSGGYGERVLAGREESQKILNYIEANAPATGKQIKAQGLNARALGSLVRRGYAKRSGKGYARTSKAFHVDPREAAG